MPKYELQCIYISFELNLNTVELIIKKIQTQNFCSFKIFFHFVHSGFRVLSIEVKRHTLVGVKYQSY